MATCNICKYAGTPSYKSPCSECKGFSKYEYKKPQTNADRIRAKSDTELARFLAHNEWECETYNDCAKCPRMTDDGCVSLSKWLKQPVEDER